MKMYLRTILCFVFVAYSHSQGYGGRARIVNKPFIGNQIQHDIGKAQVVGSELRHDTAKAVAVGQQLQHDVAKATIGGGLQPGFGLGGHIGIGSPILTNPIQHDIGKAQVVGGQLRHDTAKAATVGQQLEHDVAKATIGGGMQPGFGPVGLMGIAHGGVIPDDISSVIGSTIFGRPLTAGEMIGNVLLPRHGGTLNPDGIANGFGSVMPNGPHNLNDGWTDPLRGMPFPSDFNGQELVFDPNMNRYVIAPGSVGHQVAKATEHSIVKEANHIGLKTIGTNPVIGGMGHGNPIQHNIAKSMDDDDNHRIVKVSLGGGKSVQHNIAKAKMGGVNPIQHDMAKAGAIAAGKPIFNGDFVNRGPFGGVSAGTVGVDHPSVIAHNIGKATLGADAVQGHNLAKAAQVPVGTGFINPNGHVARTIEGEVMHDVAKSSGFGGQMVSGRMMGVHQPGMIGVSPFGGMQRPGVPMGVNVVHDVNKVGASGVATIGHDPLASSLGHGLAKGSIGDAASIIDMNTGGAVSMGNPFANAAAANLARESLHVAQKTIGLTSGGNPVKPPSGYAGRPRVF